MRAVIKNKMLMVYCVVAEPIMGEVPGAIAPPLRAISIMLEMIEGAVLSWPVKSVVHLAMIIQSI